LDALKSSEMFREDQFSYMLYPNRELPGFLSKNKIPRSFVENSQLANALHAAGNTELFTYDSHHNFYFNGDIHNAKDVKQKLDELQGFDALVAAEKEEVLKVFEQMFDHKSFTGRSGTFFAFEGLGSIYWHMVSKLLLAVQETIHRTWKEASEGHKGRLIEHYYEIRAGIGINKGPELYGAFPTDPYSHTPAHKGAQQPGMTGQVKEDIINRWAELGVKVTNGKLSFEPLFLDKKEFLSEPSRFVYFDLQGNKKELSLKSEELVFTYCQIPVIYKKDTETFIVIEKSDGQTERVEGQTLTQQLSHQFFARSGDIVQLTVHMTL